MNVERKNAFIYIKNNGIKDAAMGVRAFGSYSSGKINVKGRKLARTWSLLSERATFGMTSISLLHNPVDMV